MSPESYGPQLEQVTLSPTIWDRLTSKVRDLDMVSGDSFNILCNSPADESPIVRHANGEPLSELEITAAFEAMQDAGIIAYKESKGTAGFKVNKHEPPKEKPFETVDHSIKEHTRLGRLGIKAVNEWEEFTTSTKRRVRFIPAVAKKVGSVAEKHSADHRHKEEENRRKNEADAQNRAEWERHRTTALRLEYEPEEKLTTWSAVDILQRLNPQIGGIALGREMESAQVQSRIRYDYINLSELADIEPTYRPLFENGKVEEIAKEISGDIRDEVRVGTPYETAKAEVQQRVLTKALGPNPPQDVYDALLKAQLVAAKLIPKGRQETLRRRTQNN